MLTEQTLRDYPELVKALTGVPAESFWPMMDEIEAQYPAYERHRHTRDQRQRAVGGGRPCDVPLVMRVLMLLFYLRTHVPQTLVALLCGGTQSDVSRDLRRLLPLVQEVLPTPAIWEIVEDPDPAVPDAPPVTDPDPAVPDTPPVTDPDPAVPDAPPVTDPDPVVPDASPAAGPVDAPSLNRIATMQVLVDATEQEVARSHNREQRKQHYSGKQKEFTLKTQIVTDADHHIVAISVAVPGTMHDKKLCDALHTLEHMPDGAEVTLDKGYQGVATQVDTVTIRDATTGQEQHVPRLSVRTPHKKPRGGDLTDAQNAANRIINQLRVRVEHCIGWAKNWAILATQFRCSHEIYTSILHVVCGLVNQQTERWQKAKQAEAAYCA